MGLILSICFVIFNDCVFVGFYLAPCYGHATMHGRLLFFGGESLGGGAPPGDDTSESVCRKASKTQKAGKVSCSIHPKSMDGASKTTFLSEKLQKIPKQQNTAAQNGGFGSCLMLNKKHFKNRRNFTK